ncbi:hypothetical protein E8E12_004989 [Didymella heteroderae]|uniref:Uncharacterized protein n=1 Tax=Didymella heteroderae TaxID=1769908 RepID=A0A9P4WQI2_9PLEO|nr:hypothetical protein E8E12_004989 [Didymella heteroderae]
MTDCNVYSKVNGISEGAQSLMTTTDTIYWTKSTLDSANRLIFVGTPFYDQVQQNQKQLAAKTGKSNFPGRAMFATQAEIDVCSAWGAGVTPHVFMTSARDYVKDTK